MSSEHPPEEQQLVRGPSGCLNCGGWGCTKCEPLRARIIELEDALAKFVPPQTEGVHSFCPECGPHIAVDEDGCCRSCGATASGPFVDVLLWAWRDLKQHNDRIRRVALEEAARVVIERANKHMPPFARHDHDGAVYANLCRTADAIRALAPRAPVDLDSLEADLEEMERTNPTLRAAAKNLDAVTTEILATPKKVRR